MCGRNYALISLPIKVYSTLLFNNSMACHLKHIAKPSTWATQVELQAAGNFYGTDLYVLTEKPSKTDYHGICYAASTNLSFKEKNFTHTVCNWHIIAIALLFILMS